jgi:5'-nucleotidase
MADDFNCIFNTKYIEAIFPSTLTLNLLSKLAKKYKLGIVTNGAPDLAFKKIINLGIENYFPKNNVFVSEAVGFSKPHPEIFKIALNYFGIEAKETLFVGDNWLADIVGAINVGISAIWLNIDKSNPLTDHRPLAIIEDLEELEIILY